MIVLAMVDAPIYRFGPFELDTRSGELSRQGRRVRLPLQSRLLLRLLIERAGDTVSREDLSAALWPDGTHVDFDHGLNNAAARLRRALGDPAHAARFIETVPRAGYRFLAPVTAIRVASSPGPTSPAFTPEARPPAAAIWRSTPAVVSVAVLIFAAGLGTGLSLTTRLPAAPPVRAGAAAVEARAQADRSLLYSRMVLDGDLPAGLVVAAADRAAARALALDPSLPEAHVAAGYVAMWAQWRWEAAAQHFEAALVADRRSALAYQARALWRAAHARADEARRDIRTARTLLPHDAVIARDAARIAFVGGDVDGAVRDLDALLAVHPDDVLGHELMTEALVAQGRNADAAAHYRRYLLLIGIAERYANEDRRMLAASGLPGLMRWYLGRPMGKPADRYGVPYKMATSHAVVGDVDAALQWLERALAQRDSRLLFLKVHPRFAALRGDWRFRQLVERVGFAG